MPNLKDLGLNKEELEERAKIMLKNLKWFDKNTEKLKRLYSNKYIAIFEEEVVDSNDEMEVLKKKLENNNYELDKVLIEFVHPKDLLMIF
ncbi:MAG: hypothetical protein HWN80_17895 [Candidatus Lokiarchaeota archaeon]|nr:hypothetical protein [Candidatus Lokiarchaeota archaeon]